MRRLLAPWLAVLILVALYAVMSAPALAHGDHDHGHQHAGKGR